MNETNKQMLTILTVIENAGIKRIKEPVHRGVPLPKGKIKDVNELELVDDNNKIIECQFDVLAIWHLDKSVKWVLCSFLTDLASKQKIKYYLHQKKVSAETIRQIKSFFPNKYTNNNSQYEDWSVFHSSQNTDDNTVRLIPVLNIIGVEEIEIRFKGQRVNWSGNIFKSIANEYEVLYNGKKIPLQFSIKKTIYLSTSYLKLDVIIKNTSSAQHVGNFWDLGDEGSIYIDNFLMSINLDEFSDALCHWKDLLTSSSDYSPVRDGFSIEQSSSGGDNWQSRNHINADGEITVGFRGARIKSDSNTKSMDRVQPVIKICNSEINIEVSLLHFWQNFPKTITLNNKLLSFHVFPKDSDRGTELQAGEQKEHSFFLKIATDVKTGENLFWVPFPTVVKLEPEWVIETQVDPLFYYKKSELEYFEIIKYAVDSPFSFFEKREKIDEYGWRNFGDFFADHEAVNSNPDTPLISHYNNQFDALYACVLQFFRTGDERLWVLADDLAKHFRDIDIYHTNGDRWEFNHGMFWHTNHYIDASTSTHRCYSRNHIRSGKEYSGGGPSIHHLYLTGLIHHYYMTGDISSYNAIEELLVYVRNSCEGPKNVTEKTKSFLKGSIKKMVKYIKHINEPYHLDGPGRGAANLLNACTDGYLFTGDVKFLKNGEKLIRRCISPDDDHEKMDLINAELRWMYIMFLCSLGKYIDAVGDAKRFLGISEYARKSLLHYAKFIVEKEKPFLSQPDKLEYPNETWAAQELRKVNSLLYAAKFCDGEFKRKCLHSAKFYYIKCFEYLNNYGDKKYLCRPLVILMRDGLPGTSLF